MVRLHKQRGKGVEVVRTRAKEAIFYDFVRVSFMKRFEAVEVERTNCGQGKKGVHKRRLHKIF